jgi:hypothetical protein
MTRNMPKTIRRLEPVDLTQLGARVIPPAPGHSIYDETMPPDLGPFNPLRFWLLELAIEQLKLANHALELRLAKLEGKSRGRKNR